MTTLFYSVGVDMHYTSVYMKSKKKCAEDTFMFASRASALSDLLPARPNDVDMECLQTTSFQNSYATLLPRKLLSLMNFTFY